MGRLITTLAFLAIIGSFASDTLGDERWAPDREVIWAKTVVVQDKRLLLRMTREMPPKPVGRSAFVLYELSKQEAIALEDGKRAEPVVIYRYCDFYHTFPGLLLYDVCVDTDSGLVYIASSPGDTFAIISVGINSNPMRKRDGRYNFDRRLPDSTTQEQLHAILEAEFPDIKPVFSRREGGEGIFDVIELSLTKFRDELTVIVKTTRAPDDERRFVWSISQNKWLKTQWQQLGEG